MTEFNPLDIPYDKKIPIIHKLVGLLYSIDGCGAGGCCHVVLDDDNISDDDLKWCINFCDEHKDWIDHQLSKCICEMLLDLSFEQRVAVSCCHSNSSISNEEEWKNFLERNNEYITDTYKWQTEEKYEV